MISCLKTIILRTAFIILFNPDKNNLKFIILNSIPIYEGTSSDKAKNLFTGTKRAVWKYTTLYGSPNKLI